MRGVVYGFCGVLEARDRPVRAGYVLGGVRLPINLIMGTRCWVARRIREGRILRGGGGRSWRGWDGACSEGYMPSCLFAR